MPTVHSSENLECVNSSSATSRGKHRPMGRPNRIRHISGARPVKKMVLSGAMMSHALDRGSFTMEIHKGASTGKTVRSIARRGRPLSRVASSGSLSRLEMSGAKGQGLLLRRNMGVESWHNQRVCCALSPLALIYSCRRAIGRSSGLCRYCPRSGGLLQMAEYMRSSVYSKYSHGARSLAGR